MTNYDEQADQVKLAVNVNCTVTIDRDFTQRTLYPLRRARFSMPAYRLLQGVPMPVPNIDVHSVSTVSLSGATVTNTRPSPLQVTPTSVARWLPTVATYNGVDTWNALAGGTRKLATSALYAPTMVNDFTYYVGKDLITRDAMLLSTDSLQHFWTDFTPATEAEWSMVLVACPLPPKRNPLGQSDYYGVLETDGLGADDIGLRQFATAIQYYQGAQSNATSLAIGSQTPVIYAISATATTIRFYRRSLGVTWRVTLARGAAGLYAMNLLIGRSAGVLTHTANMALMEVNYYDTRLDDDVFEIEASNIYSAYGNYAGVS